jgi:hypothetical protein
MLSNSFIVQYFKLNAIPLYNDLVTLKLCLAMNLLVYTEPNTRAPPLRALLLLDRKVLMTTASGPGRG